MDEAHKKVVSHDESKIEASKIEEANTVVQLPKKLEKPLCLSKYVKLVEIEYSKCTDIFKQKQKRNCRKGCDSGETRGN